MIPEEAEGQEIEAESDETFFKSHLRSHRYRTPRHFNLCAQGQLMIARIFLAYGCHQRMFTKHTPSVFEDFSVMVSVEPFVRG